MSFFLPTLLEYYGEEFVVYVTINKCDERMEMDKKSIHHQLKSFFPGVVVMTSGKGMKKNINSLFRGVMRRLMVGKNEGSCMIVV